MENSDEIVAILPSIKKIGAKIVAMTGNRNSKLGREADYILNIGVKREGCPLNLAPMSSTTSTLVMGDALAAIHYQEKEISSQKILHCNHPGGSLGKKTFDEKVKEM